MTLVYYRYTWSYTQNRWNGDVGLFENVKGFTQSRRFIQIYREWLHFRTKANADSRLVLHELPVHQVLT